MLFVIATWQFVAQLLEDRTLMSTSTPRSRNALANGATRRVMGVVIDKASSRSPKTKKMESCLPARFGFFFFVSFAEQAALCESKSQER